INDGSTPSEINVNPSDVFTLLNRASAINAIDINISANKVIEQPLQIIYISHGKNIIANNQLSINAGMSSQASLVVTNISENGENCLNNVVTTVNLEANSNFTIHKIQAESESNFIISTEEIKQEA